MTDADELRRDLFLAANPAPLTIDGLREIVAKHYLVLGLSAKFLAPHVGQTVFSTNCMQLPRPDGMLGSTASRAVVDFALRARPRMVAVIWRKMAGVRIRHRGAAYLVWCAEPTINLETDIESDSIRMKMYASAYIWGEDEHADVMARYDLRVNKPGIGRLQQVFGL